MRYPMVYIYRDPHFGTFYTWSTNVDEPIKMYNGQSEQAQLLFQPAEVSASEFLSMIGVSSPRGVIGRPTPLGIVWEPA